MVLQARVEGRLVDEVEAGRLMSTPSITEGVGLLEEGGTDQSVEEVTSCSMGGRWLMLEEEISLLMIRLKFGRITTFTTMQPNMTIFQEQSIPGNLNLLLVNNDLWFRPDPPAPDTVGAEPEAFTCPKCNKEFRNMTLLTRLLFFLFFGLSYFSSGMSMTAWTGTSDHTCHEKQS